MPNMTEPKARTADCALYAFSCGTVRMKKKAAIDDGEGMVNLPVPAYLFRHPAGNLLFDTGLHPDLIDPDSDRLGALGKYSQVMLSEAEMLDAHLAALDLAADDIRYVVNSHLHYDHCGGNVLFPDATFLVSEQEWQAAHQPELLARLGYIPSDYDLGYSVRQIAGNHDVFGDGSFVLFQTPGHTPGHMSARVTIGDARIILVADVCYLKENYDRREVSRLSYDKPAAMESLLALHALADQGWDVRVPHDEAVWATIPKSPVPMARG